MRNLLRQRQRAVLAPASGGCAQYIFSTEVVLRLDATGVIEVQLPLRTDSQRSLLNETTLSLRIPLDVEPDGTERSHLVLAGHLQESPDNESNGWLPFCVSRAHRADISGTIQTIALGDLGIK